MSDTDEHRAERIRVRAYFLWQEAGSPEGGEAWFWEQARGLEQPDADAGVDAAEEASFPASDPPSSTPVIGPERPVGKSTT